MHSSFYVWACVVVSNLTQVNSFTRTLGLGPGLGLPWDQVDWKSCCETSQTTRVRQFVASVWPLLSSVWYNLMTHFYRYKLCCRRDHRSLTDTRSEMFPGHWRTLSTLCCSYGHQYYIRRCLITHSDKSRTSTVHCYIAAQTTATSIGYKIIAAKIGQTDMTDVHISWLGNKARHNAGRSMSKKTLRITDNW